MSPHGDIIKVARYKEAKLSYCGNLLGENRNGLIVNSEVFEANGTAERDAAQPRQVVESLTGRAF